MASYILCQHKRNLPRIDVRICQERCPERDGCQELRDFLAATPPDLPAVQAEALPVDEQPL